MSRSKTGGRKKGSRNKDKLRLEAVTSILAEEGMTPLDVMLKAMRKAVEENDLKFACLVAKDAAPYVHQKLAALEISGSLDNAGELTDAQLNNRIATLLATVQRDRDLEGTGDAAGGAEEAPRPH